MRSSCLINVNTVKLKGRRQHCSSDNSFISVYLSQYFFKLLYEFCDRSLSEKKSHAMGGHIASRTYLNIIVDAVL